MATAASTINNAINPLRLFKLRTVRVAEESAAEAVLEREILSMA